MLLIIFRLVRVIENPCFLNPSSGINGRGEAGERIIENHRISGCKGPQESSGPIFLRQDGLAPSPADS